jgi:hypothetical protein
MAQQPACITAALHGIKLVSRNHGAHSYWNRQCREMASAAASLAARVLFFWDNLMHALQVSAEFRA